MSKAVIPLSIEMCQSMGKDEKDEKMCEMVEVPIREETKEETKQETKNEEETIIERVVDVMVGMIGFLKYLVLMVVMVGLLITFGPLIPIGLNRMSKKKMSKKDFYYFVIFSSFVMIFSWVFVITEFF